MCVESARQSICGPHSPGEARGFCTDYLAAALLPALLQRRVIADVAVVVSELVTNALRAAATHIVVRIAAGCDDVWLWVSDNAPGTPQVQHPGPQENHGRGLLIVAGLAAGWGVQREQDGKQVWVRFVFAGSASVVARTGLVRQSTDAHRLCLQA